MLVNRSTDGGLTWSAPITLIREDSAFNFNDKNSITADPFDSELRLRRSGTAAGSRATSGRSHSIAGFPRSVRSDAFFTRTTNGGLTWEAPRAIFRPQANEFGIGHQIVVLSDGTLVDGFMLFHGSGSNKTGQEVAVMISHDKGVTWTAPIRVAKALPGFISDPDDGTPVRTGDIIPEIAAGPNRSVYMVWQEATLAPSGSAIALSRSLDGGLTWSAPRRINTVPTTPGVHPVDRGAAGRHARRDPLRLPVQHSGRRGHAAHRLLVPALPRRRSDLGRVPRDRARRSTCARHRSPEGCSLGDYEGLATQSGQFLALFSQSHGTDPASAFFSRITP